MTYRIEIGRRARKGLSRAPRKDQARILTRLGALAEDPRPSGCRAVKGAPKGTYRVRVGGYRLVYTVLERDEVIVVARVVRRDKDTYRRLA